MISLVFCQCTMLCLVIQPYPTLCNPMNCSPPDSSVHGDSPGKNTGVGYHALLQGIFLIQGSPILCLLHNSVSPDNSFFTSSATWEAQF